MNDFMKVYSEEDWQYLCCELSMCSKEKKNSIKAWLRREFGFKSKLILRDVNKELHAMDVIEQCDPLYL